MVGWYKHDIPDWMDGTEGLSDGAYRAYHVVCQLIYLNEGPIANNERGIAGRCNQSVRAFKKHLAELTDGGKLVIENGRISNSRALFELETVKTNRENAKLGGENSGKSRNARSKALKNNNTDEAPLQNNRSHKRREEKKRKDSPPTPQGGSGDIACKPDDGFEEFWAVVPRKKAVRSAEKAYRSACKRAPPSEILAGMKRYAVSVAGKEPQFISYPASWLNGDRWADDPEPERQQMNGKSDNDRMLENIGRDINRDRRATG